MKGALWFLLLLNVAFAFGQPKPGMLRGTGLEIVDDQGRPRAQITVTPAGEGYEETVILRLITADGKPRVKLATAVDQSGLMLLGDSDTTHAILQADGSHSTLLLRDDETKQQRWAP